jgi:hypothetical protein
MERGVYFDAWFPRQHNYHPSLPARRLRMIDDLRDYRATVLVWSALGGGSIALPYLEEEAWGEIPARFRVYGFVNDSEFIQECQKHGIKVFGIVFEVQGWEFPAELNEAEDQILSFNELRGVGKRAWMGLREFGQNRYPKLWAPLEHYFPDGLLNSDGEHVTDLLTECASVDIYGEPCHALWVECPDREHYCYTMDRNNPVWREYLKAIIRIQIDAGVDGIQLDEAELPLTTVQYGGCFCKDCMKGFRAYLQALPADQQPAELAGVDLDTFHYGAWLLQQGYDFKTRRDESPLFFTYIRYQRGQIKRYFAELADYAREYAQEKGRSVLVSGNFFNLNDEYYPLEPSVDLLITEMRNTRYRQPEWYRYVRGFAADKPVVVVENPYGGVVPELIDLLGRGRGYDLFRLSLYEAAAMGTNMSAPYGSWMGSRQEDAFYAPHDLVVEVQSFIAEHEALYSTQSYAEIGVVFSTESNFELIARQAAFADNLRNETVAGLEIAFWEVTAQLSRQAQPYDVILFPDAKLRADQIRLDHLQRYRTLVLPQCSYLTPNQAHVLLGYLNGGGQIVVIAPLGVNLPEETRQAITNHQGTILHGTTDDALAAGLPGETQVIINQQADLGLHIQRLADGAAAVHIVNYAYDQIQDTISAVTGAELAVRLPCTFTSATVYVPGAQPRAVEVQTANDVHRVWLDQLSVYTIVLLHDERTSPAE